MSNYSEYFNRITSAARHGKLLWMPDQDGATVMKPVGVHSGFEPETGLEDDYRILIKSGNTVVPNTGRPEIFFRAAYPNIHDQFWIVSEMGARITSPGGKIEFEKTLPNRDQLIDVLKRELEKFPGGFIEDGKVCAITLALTDADDRSGAYNHLLRLVGEMARGSTDMHIKSGFLPYNTHIELVPSNVDKGSATEFFVNSEAFRDHLIVCIGDSDPDADMMAVANDVGGISIGVGPRAPGNTHIQFQDHEQVQLFIHQIAEHVSFQPR
jgi:trehalose-6-phosphatase